MTVQTLITYAVGALVALTVVSWVAPIVAATFHLTTLGVN